MPVTLDLDVGELAGTRFATSPLSETISGLQLLGHGGPTHQRWLRWATDALGDRPLRLPRTWPLIVNDRASWPQFLLPAPARAASTIEDDLTAMQATTPGQVRASLQRVFGDDPPASAAELGVRTVPGLREIADELREAYERLIAPHWSRIRAVLDADIAYRARQLAAGGAQKLFADLHPDLSWRDGRITVDNDRRDRAIDVAPGGLVLVPLVLGPARVIVKRATTTQTTVRYPARGVGTLWTLDAPPVQDSLIRLLGRHRAELLDQLRSPATTTDLARALHVTPSAVAQHIAILRENDLVTGQRTGRTVLYSTTERGLSLLERS